MHAPKQNLHVLFWSHGDAADAETRSSGYVGTTGPLAPARSGRRPGWRSRSRHLTSPLFPEGIRRSVCAPKIFIKAAYEDRRRVYLLEELGIWSLLTLVAIALFGSILFIIIGLHRRLQVGGLWSQCLGWVGRPWGRAGCTLMEDSRWLGGVESWGEEQWRLW